MFVDACAAGAEAFQRRDFPAAERALESCIVAQPARLEAHIMLASLLQSRGDSEALYRLVSNGMKQFPAEKRFYLTAATLDARAKRYDASIRTLEQALRRWPEDEKLKTLLASAYFALGSGLMDAGDNENALGHLKRSVRLAPDDLEARMNLGRTLHNLRRGTEALQEFEGVRKHNAEYALLRFHLATTHYLLGEFDAAIAHAAAEIEKNSDYAPAYYVRGMARIALGEWDRALADLHVAAARMPRDAQARYAFARALAQVDRLAEAEAELRSAIDLDPSDPAPVNSLVAVLLRLGRSQEAAALKSQAAELGLKRRSANPGEIRFERSGRPRP